MTQNIKDEIEKQRVNKELNCSDYFFENKKSIRIFLNENGLETIITLMVNLIKLISNKVENNLDYIKDIYEIIY